MELADAEGATLAWTWGTWGSPDHQLRDGERLVATFGWRGPPWKRRISGELLGERWTFRIRGFVHVRYVFTHGGGELPERTFELVQVRSGMRRTEAYRGSNGRTYTITRRADRHGRDLFIEDGTLALSWTFDRSPLVAAIRVGEGAATDPDSKWFIIFYQYFAELLSRVAWG
jgi:hypothetical protein